MVEQGSIELGADANKPGAEGQTALSYAAQQGHMEVAKLLIEAGADVDKPDASGRTPRDGAARFGQIEMLRLLGGGDLK